MPIPRIYVDEPCTLDGYEGLTVRVLANSTDAEWRQWAAGNLGTPGCEACTKRNKGTTGGERRYCPNCAAARQAYGQAIVRFFGPTLLDHDVATEAAALALFDDDNLLPSEIVIWLQLVPGVVRSRRQEQLLGNLTGSLTTPST